MIQGTGSDVGKSLVVAGLARAFTRRGLRVRPFKPQNMSNNAAATSDGGEIGRAQALQARACGVAPSVDMNPVLLKPEAERRAQLVVQGRARGAVGATDYGRVKAGLMAPVLASYHRLAAAADLMLVEGAGSPAEVNLRQGDIANMGFAEAADLPVLLVGDVDRGGVIAALVGTHALLPPAEAARVRGFVVNKFRGDPALFADAPPLIAERTGWPSLGLLPWFADATLLPAEDSAGLDRPAAITDGRSITVAVPRLGRIANFDDLDPLGAEPDVAVRMIPPGRPLPADADLVLLPGSKATRADLAQLRAEGWDIDIRAHVRRGRPVLGLCGGYQMLGRTVADPDGVEGAPGTDAGLGLLAVDTVMGCDKVLTPVTAATTDGVPVTGFEMHVGRTDGPDRARPMFRVDGRDEGAVSADGLVSGTYLHGLFAADRFRAAFLGRLRSGRIGRDGWEARVDATLDALAAHVEAHLALDRILAIAGR
jgi:adenosylcobyric acid synthase